MDNGKLIWYGVCVLRDAVAVRWLTLRVGRGRILDYMCMHVMRRGAHRSLHVYMVNGVLKMLVS